MTLPSQTPADGLAHSTDPGAGMTRINTWVGSAAECQEVTLPPSAFRAPHFSPLSPKAQAMRRGECMQSREEQMA